MVGPYSKTNAFKLAKLAAFIIYPIRESPSYFASG